MELLKKTRQDGQESKGNLKKECGVEDLHDRESEQRTLTASRWVVERMQG